MGSALLLDTSRAVRSAHAMAAVVPRRTMVADPAARHDGAANDRVQPHFPCRRRPLRAVHLHGNDHLGIRGRHRVGRLARIRAGRCVHQADAPPARHLHVAYGAHQSHRVRLCEHRSGRLGAARDAGNIRLAVARRVCSCSRFCSRRDGRWGRFLPILRRASATCRTRSGSSCKRSGSFRPCTSKPMFSQGRTSRARRRQSDLSSAADRARAAARWRMADARELRICPCNPGRVRVACVVGGTDDGTSGSSFTCEQRFHSTHRRQSSLCVGRLRRAVVEGTAGPRVSSHYSQQRHCRRACASRRVARHRLRRAYRPRGSQRRRQEHAAAGDRSALLRKR